MHESFSNSIVITGIGLCTPFGPDRETSWRGLLSGESAVRWLSPPHWTDANLMAGAPVRLPEDRPFRHTEPLVELALTTATESLSDARLTSTDLKQKTVGVVFGNSKGGLHTFARLHNEQRPSSPSLQPQPDPSAPSDDWLDFLPNRAASAIGQMIGGYGPVFCPVAACATGLAACLRGAELIQSGDCDIVLAGSADVSLQPAVLGSFRRLGVLSKESTDAARACRPYHRNRSGFVVGEGAACLVLERRESAMARGADCYAEWNGGFMLSDPSGLTQLDPSGTTLRKLLQKLAEKSGQLPDYLNLHGTGTISNDLVECRAIEAEFGRGIQEIACSSLKGGLGHLLGAAGSVELAATAMAIRHQIVPPIVNLDDVDPGCRLSLTPMRAMRKPIRSAWKISMGFGGHVAGACLLAPGTGPRRVPVSLG